MKDTVSFFCVIAIIILLFLRQYLLPIIMKITILAAALSSANAFSTTTNTQAFSRSSVSLNASRNKAKIASRSKWAESRGISGGAAVDDSDSATAGLMTNDDGLEYVRLANDNGDTSDVYLFGGVVTSYVTGMCYDIYMLYVLYLSTSSL